MAVCYCLQCLKGSFFWRWQCHVQNDLIDLYWKAGGKQNHALMMEYFRKYHFQTVSYEIDFELILAQLYRPKLNLRSVQHDFLERLDWWVGPYMCCSSKIYCCLLTFFHHRGIIFEESTQIHYCEYDFHSWSCWRILQEKGLQEDYSKVEEPN